MLRLTSQLARVSSTLTYKSLATASHKPNNGNLFDSTEARNPMGSYVYISKNHGKDYLTEEEV
jgi:hypothetical protein